MTTPRTMCAIFVGEHACRSAALSGVVANATRAAVEEGIVPGGGVALLRAKKAVEALKSDNADVQAGINIVAKALEAPIRQIVENAGVEGSIVVGKLLEKSGNYGFNAQTEEYVDMVAAGIIDPKARLPPGAFAPFLMVHVLIGHERLCASP